MLKEKYYTEVTEVDKLIFEKLVPAEHYLRKVKEVIDFERLREKVVDCYSPDMGRGAEDPVLLIKLEYLQFHYSLSDREVIQQAQVNVAYRYFLDLSLESKLPVASLLAQFRARLGQQRHLQLFEEVVRQARERGLVKDKLRLKDATHIIANIAVPSTISLVAQTRDRLLNAIKPYAGRFVREQEQKREQIRLQTEDLKDEERLLQRVVHLQQIVDSAQQLQKRLGTPRRTDKARQKFDQALELAHKVLADRDEKRKEKSDRTLSVVDQDARRNKHGSYYDGYLLDISMDADSEIITALDVLPSNGDEAANAIELIQSEESAQGNDIEEMSIDSIGFRGDVIKGLRDKFSLFTAS